MIRKFLTRLFRRAQPKQSMVYRLFLLISLLDQSITRDRAIIAAAEERIAVASRRKAWAQRLLGRQRP